MYDYGDSIRFGAATGVEDAQDAQQVALDLGLFESYTRGFLSACSGLTPREVELLPMGAKIMTLECGLRFLTDYLEGDHYFANHRPKKGRHLCPPFCPGGAYPCRRKGADGLALFGQLPGIFVLLVKICKFFRKETCFFLSVSAKLDSGKKRRFLRKVPCFPRKQTHLCH